MNKSKNIKFPSPRERVRERGIFKNLGNQKYPSLEFVSSLAFTNKFFSLPKRDKLFAFTLAEVLVTLGVIGVVAAMTLPIITSKIEKQVLRTQFMKQYRNIVATRQAMEAENGALINCYTTYPPLTTVYSDCRAFWNTFFEKYKVIKTCKYGTANCSPTYKTMSEVVANGGFYNSSMDYIDQQPYTAHILSDGAIIYIADKNHRQTYFYVDVNGAKGPNKWGYDIFHMILHKNSSKLTDQPYPICEKGGRRVKNMLLNNDSVNSNVLQE